VRILTSDHGLRWEDRGELRLVPAAVGVPLDLPLDVRPFGDGLRADGCVEADAAVTCAAFISDDGVNWEEFDPVVDDMTRADFGWLGLDAERGSLVMSADGRAWQTVPYPREFDPRPPEPRSGGFVAGAAADLIYFHGVIDQFELGPSWIGRLVPGDE
jgi:hypothetical protein